MPAGGRVDWYGDAVVARLNAGARTGAKDLAVRIANRARDYAPERRGDMRAAIMAVESVSHSGYDVVVGVRYASFVELGTVRMAPRPFLSRAVAELEPEFERIVAGGFSGVGP